MKKTTLMLLLYMGSVLLVHVAQADETGFGGELAIGGSFANGRLSQLDANAAERRLVRLNEPGDQVSHFEPYLGGELHYTLSNGHSAFFITNWNSDAGLALGFRHALGDMGRFSMAGAFESREVWQNPYLVTVPRKPTDEITLGLAFELENILGSNVVLSSKIMEVDVKKDAIGDREKVLRRDGYRSNFEAGYIMGLDENQQIVPMVRYERNDLKGKADSSEEYAIAIGHEWRMGSWEGETSVGIGWTNYRKDHPVFNQKRQATTYDVSMLIAYYEPLGWSQVSIYGTASYRLVEEKIAFFDSDFWTYGLGASYQF